MFKGGSDDEATRRAARQTRRVRAPPKGTPVSGFRVVLPAVEVNLGTVAFLHDGEWRSFWVAEPAALLSALANPVQPSRWHPEQSTLTVTVARTGCRAGEERVFPLCGEAPELSTVSDSRTHFG